MIKRLITTVLVIAALVGLSADALTQSTPGLVRGQVPTAAQWNSYFALKQDVLGFVPVNKNGDTMLGRLVTAAPGSSTGSGLRLPPGTAPASPVNGDVWTTTAGVFARINGTTVGPLIGPGAPIPPADLPPGVNTNVLATGAIITSAPTVNSAFCGKTAALGGSAFFTFTVGAASGFPENCVMLVVNADKTSAGKHMAISGITIGKSDTLWPDQGFILANVNNVWTAIGPPARWVLRGTTAFFVDSTLGSDTNDGLAAGSGRAWATKQKAVNTLCGELDPNLNFMTFTFAFGTYTKSLLCQFPGYSNSLGYGQATFTATPTAVSITIASPGVITWTGHAITANQSVFFYGGTLPGGLTTGIPYFVIGGSITANTFQVSASLTAGAAGAAVNTTGTASGVTAIAPMKTKITASGGSGIGIFAQTNTPMLFKGFQFTNCTTFCVEADNAAVIALSAVDFGSAGNHVESLYGSTVVFATDGYTISAPFDVHWYAQEQSRIFIQPGKTVGVIGVPAIGLFYVFADSQGLANYTSTTFIGTATGVRCSITNGGGVNTGTGDVTFLPGNSGCTPTGATFGWYTYLLQRDLGDAPANDNTPLKLDIAA